MPELTRRLSKDRDDCWHIYFGDVQVSAVAIRIGIDRARADFEDAWRIFLSNRTEADLQEWRDQRDWTARK
jgi:hypothetical protein